jgi:inner membrane protein
MHVPTHILSGWCVGSLFRFSARERLFCMVAAGVADLDGISILFGEEAYWDIHHVWGHNLMVGVLVAAVLAGLSKRPFVAGAVYLSLFHLHLVMDCYGSGPNWPIVYLWPFSDSAWVTPHAWELSSWQNRLAAGFLLGWTLWIAYRHGHTPVELLAPRLDRAFVRWIRRDRVEDVVLHRHS